MDDVDLKIAAMEKELTELRTRINSLGERLGHGENAVRADLNPAIRRERELSSELHDLKVSSGRLATNDLMTQVSVRPTGGWTQATFRATGRGNPQTGRYWQSSWNLATAIRA